MVPCSFSARRSAPLEARAALHLTCAGDVHLDETLTIVSRDELESNQHSAYRAALLRSTGPSAEPLRDRHNRPRVTLKIIGNAATDRAASWVDLQTHARDMAVCSARCEYVFEAVRHDESMLAPTDRRRPIGACVVAALVEPPTSKVHAAKLAAMFEAGYGAPLLWVLGEGSRDARDARVRALRALLDDAGYDPDEAVALCADRVDPEALAALALALDERPADGAALDPAGRFEACIDALERALALGDPSAITLRCGRVARHLSRYPARGAVTMPTMALRPELEARARAAAARCLSVIEAREAGVDVLWRFSNGRDAPAVAAMLAAMWTEPLRSLGALFSKAHGFVRQHDTVAAAALLVDGFVHRKTGAQRRKDLAAMLLGVAGVDVAGMLRDRAPGADAAIAKQAMDLAALIERGRAR